MPSASLAGPRSVSYHERSASPAPGWSQRRQHRRDQHLYALSSPDPSDNWIRLIGMILAFAGNWDATALGTLALAVVTGASLVFGWKSLRQGQKEVEEAHRPVLVPLADSRPMIVVEMGEILQVGIAGATTLASASPERARSTQAWRPWAARSNRA